METLNQKSIRIIGESLITAVVNADRVEALCAQGYRLVEITYSDRIGLAVEETAKEDQYGNKLAVRSVEKALVLREPLFVMAQSADDRLAREREESAKLKAQLEERERVCKAMGEEIEGHKKHVTSLQDDVQRAHKYSRSRETEIDSAHTKNRKLEGDIGKLRTAIGDLRMKEILEGG